MTRAGVLVVLLVMATACRGESAMAVPARLVAPDSTTRAELQRAVADALGDREVVLAETALTADSQLLVERRRHVAPDGTRIMGRDLEAPERFRLFRAGATCVLEHLGSGRRFTLANAVCTPETGH